MVEVYIQGPHKNSMNNVYHFESQLPRSQHEHSARRLHPIFALKMCWKKVYSTDFVTKIYKIVTQKKTNTL